MHTDADVARLERFSQMGREAQPMANSFGFTLANQQAFDAGAQYFDQARLPPTGEEGWMIKNRIGAKGMTTRIPISAVIASAVLAFLTQLHAQNVQFKNPSELAKPAGYSHVVIVNRGKLAFISGQVGSDKDGKVSADFRMQARQAFVNLRAALTAAGAKPADLVKLNYYVVGLNHEKLLAIREERDQIIDKDNPPASTLAGVQALFGEDVQLEIEAEAVIP